MICPFATYRPVPNHGGKMDGYLGVVIHVTVGEVSPYPEFDNPANQASSHFGILNDGTIEQYVDTALQSWAQAAGNSTYISVETVGMPTDPLTSPQVQSFATLYRWLNQTHGVPFVITGTPGQPGFITHGDGGAAWGGHTGCPGLPRSQQRQQILDLAHLSEDDLQPATVNYNGAHHTFVIEGGRLYDHGPGYNSDWTAYTGAPAVQGNPVPEIVNTLLCVWCVGVDGNLYNYCADGANGKSVNAYKQP